MDDSRFVNVTQLREFLKGSQQLNLSLSSGDIGRKYAFIDNTVDRLEYRRLNRKDKTAVRHYLKKLTGYRHSQLNRLINRAIEGKLQRQPYHRVNPRRIYTSTDIKLLETTDELHLRLSEKATKEILRREFEIFGKPEYQTMAGISHGHITNLRHSPIYKSHWVNHTQARQVPIGITRPPENFGKPGSIRIDTVHQRDVYHINAVDEISQWEILVCVPQICEDWMVSALELLLDQFPFIIFNFHSDRGAEAINYLVADFLERLLIRQTKSRARHPGDNALVETKNGAVVRKNMGWEHINQKFADRINDYYRNFFNPYLNFHRPCGYPTIVTDDKGKQRRMYHTYQPPYEALKGITGGRKFLKPGISFEKLDTIAYQYSDNEFAQLMRQEERKLFNQIRQHDLRLGSRRFSGS